MNYPCPQEIKSALNVPRETFDKLQAYVNLIVKWNKSINLISASDLDNIWEKHILLCAELMQYIPNIKAKVVDLGSGGGLPGIVLSIMGLQDITLIEANSKKASFLLQAGQLSDNTVNVVNDRIENLRLCCDIVTSRALASIDKLIAMNKYIAFNDKMILMKGPKIDKELSFHPKLNFAIINSRHNTNSNIVIIEKLNGEEDNFNS